MKQDKCLSLLEIIIFLIILLILFIVVANHTKEYKITFITNTDISLDSIYVKKGDKVSEPIILTKDNYKFIGWYYNDKQYDFNNLVIEDITLEAKWEEIKENS